MSIFSTLGDPLGLQSTLVYAPEAKKKKERQELPPSNSGADVVTGWIGFQAVHTHLGQICALKGLSTDCSG